MERCRLLDLPPELRNMVYRAALVESSPVHLARGHKIVCPTYASIMEPFLLSTCRQIRKEALAIFWAENTFQFTFINDILEWLRVLAPKKVAMIQQLRRGLGKEDSLEQAHNMIAVIDEDVEYRARYPRFHHISRPEQGVFRVALKHPNDENRLLWVSDKADAIVHESRGGVDTGRVYKVGKAYPLQLIPVIEGGN